MVSRSIDRRQLLVIAVALMCLTVMPGSAAAAGDNLVVGSQHSTDTEFTNGNLTNLTVEGSGESASVVLPTKNIVDNFEDGDIAEYSGDTGQFGNTTNVVKDGSYALKGTTSGNPYGISSTSGLSNYPQAGDKFSTWMRVASSSSGAQPEIQYAAQSETDLPNGYRVELDVANDEIKLKRVDSNGATTLDNASVTLSEDTWYRVEVDWGSDGSHTVTIYESGSSIKSLSASDKTFTSGGFGVIVNSNTGSSTTAYWDYIYQNGPESGEYKSANHSVSNAEEAAINITGATNVSATLNVEYWDGNSWVSGNKTTVTTTGNHTLTLPDVSSGKWRLNATVKKDGSNPDFSLADESILFTNQHPSIDNASASPSGGSLVTSTPVTLSVDVSDPQFGTAQGESLTVTFYDGADDSVIGTDTLSSNGTASVQENDPVAGNNSWYVIVEDSYGGTTDSRNVHGGVFKYQAPSELKIYHETNPSKLIDENTSFRVRFFVEGNEKIIEKQTSNGTVSLEGLPADQWFIVTVRANNSSQYTYRRIIVDSLIETQSVYVLNKSKRNSEVIFQLDDPTGQFPPEETTLYIEKPITKDFDGDGDNETRYAVMAGDVFGAAAEFPMILQDDSRYRLRVKADNSSRILGAYSVHGDDVQPLLIERIAPRGNTSTGSAIYGSIEDPENGDRRLAIRYRDPGKKTVSVTYRVLYENGTVWIENTTRTVDSFADFYLLPNNTSADASFTVEYEVTRKNSSYAGSFQAGQIPAIATRFNMNPQVLGIVSWVAILSMMGLTVIVNPSLAPISGTGMATVLTIMGTVTVPAPILGISGAIGVLVLMGGR